MIKKWILFALFAFVVPSLLAACGPASGPSPDLEERHPFSLHIASEDGAEIRWEAHSEGYQPGAIETTHLSVSNNTDQPWRGRFCVLLLEPDPFSEVFLLAEKKFASEPGLGFDDTVGIALPVDLQPGTYGLALVVHRPAGPAVHVVSIQIGDGSEERPINPWPTDAALRACPSLVGSD